MPNEQQRANLKKLADYLAALPEGYGHFNMWVYMKHNGDEVNPQDLDTICYPCGTVACAAGHGPAAGIAVPEGVDDWNSYCHEVFDADPLGEAAQQSVYTWLFTGAWKDTDNTPQGAAKRIYYYLEHDVPHNYTKQLYDSDAYMFAQENSNASE